MPTISIGPLAVATVAILACHFLTAELLADEKPCGKKFSKVALTDADRAVFTHLNKLSEDRDEFLKSMVILLAISELESAPRSIDDLAEELAKSQFAPVSDDAFQAAAKGVVQLSAKPTYEAIALILAGKAVSLDERFKEYRPKGDVRRLLQCLHDHYYRLVTSGTP